MEHKLVLDRAGVGRTISRLAHEIIERNKDLDRLALLGIRTGGAHLAKRIWEQIKEVSGQDVAMGILDITLYRDDLTEIGPQPEVRGTRIDFDVREKTIVLVDDVLFTGRTIRSAIDQIIDFGRPRSIQLAVLVDRGHRELPIRPDFVGKNVPTSLDERVEVNLKEEGKEEQVVIQAGKKP